MIKRFFILFLLSTILSTTGNYAQAVNPDSEKAKVKAVVDDFQKFWETKDMNLFSRIMAHDADMVNYGSDENGIFIGWDALKDSIQKILQTIEKTKITVKNQFIKIDKDANAAWFAEIWDWDLIYGGQPVKIQGQRFTGVLEKRNGNWVIVQFHNSVPVTQ